MTQDKMIPLIILNNFIRRIILSCGSCTQTGSTPPTGHCALHCWPENIVVVILIVKPKSSPKSKSKIQVQNPSPKSKVQRKMLFSYFRCLKLEVFLSHNASSVLICKSFLTRFLKPWKFQFKLAWQKSKYDIFPLFKNLMLSDFKAWLFKTML